jgi:hypothetical protein
VSGSRPAAAGGVDVEVTPDAEPIVTDADLRAALGPRLARVERPAGPVLVVVERARFDRLRVTTRAAHSGERTSEVLVGSRRGAEAARLAALVAVDLVAVSPEDLSAPELAAAAPREGRWLLGLGLQGGRGLAGAAGFEPTASITLLAGSSVGAGVSVGYATTAGERGELYARMHAFPLRAYLRLSAGRFAFQAGPLVRPFLATGGADREARVLFGGAAAARLELPLAGAFGAAVALGAAVVPRRVDVRVAGRRLFVTEAILPFAGVSLTWRDRR